MSWEDAKTYVLWLGETTRRPYRLPSEAEWEYACRAGTTTLYYRGDEEPTPADANYSQSSYPKTTEVGFYPANPWGLHDLSGNVWEWLEDRWKDSYAGASTNGTAWTSNDQYWRVLRGGSWFIPPSLLRSAHRFGNHSDFRLDYIGFRVARMLR